MKTTLSHADLLHGKSCTPCAVEAVSQNKARLLLLLITVALFVFIQSATAATIEVSNNNNSGSGSLRQAIITANANANPDVITITYADMIEIASPLPELRHEVQIRGEGHQPVVQPASGVECRIFTVAAGATVAISGITIRNGLSAASFVGGNGQGGGIFNSGKLTLLRCEIAGNQAVGANHPSGNGGAGRGGGIYNNSNATLIVDHCTIAGNRATGGSGNASSGTGGDGEGGGIYNLGRLTILSSTLSGNLVQRGTGDTDGEANGGGLFSGPAPVNPVLTSCTVSNNLAALGGGLYASRPCTIRSTILGENSATSGPECYGTLNSQDYNLIETTGGIIIGGTTTHNKTNTPANLGPLQANGHYTRTHMPNSSSPAINNGDDAILNAPLNITTDQRLLTRKTYAGVDIGAVEAEAYEAPPHDFNGDGYSDFTLYRSSDRKTALWYLTGNSYDSSAYGPALPAGWQLVGCGDFNDDGQSDYLLLNSTTRQTAVWFMANATFTGSAYGPTLPEGWTLVCTAQFGITSSWDYLLFKPATRQTAVWYIDWYMDKIIYYSPQYGPTIPSGWALLGAADFDSDVQPDFLLYHAATRKTAIWILKENAYDHNAYGPIAPSGWEVAGVTDFNANGTGDLVLFNPSTRETAIWYLTGTQISSYAYGPTLPSGWQLVSP